MTTEGRLRSLRKELAGYIFQMPASLRSDAPGVLLDELAQVFTERDARPLPGANRIPPPAPARWPPLEAAYRAGSFHAKELTDIEARADMVEARLVGADSAHMPCPDEASLAGMDAYWAAEGGQQQEEEGAPPPLAAGLVRCKICLRVVLLPSFGEHVQRCRAILEEREAAAAADEAARAAAATPDGLRRRKKKLKKRMPDGTFGGWEEDGGEERPSKRSRVAGGAAAVPAAGSWIPWGEGWQRAAEDPEPLAGQAWGWGRRRRHRLRGIIAGMFYRHNIPAPGA